MKARIYKKERDERPWCVNFGPFLYTFVEFDEARLFAGWEKFRSTWYLPQSANGVLLEA